MKENMYTALMNLYTRGDRSQIIFDVKKKKKSIEDFKNDARRQSKSFFKNEPDEEIESTITELAENLFSYSVLTPLLNDKTISDIKVHDWNRIIIKKNGHKSVSDVKFKSYEHYKRFIENVITRNETNASNVNAIARFTDDDTDPDFIMRFTLVTPYLTTNKNYELIIRKIPKNFYSMDELVKLNMMDEKIKNYLISSWNAGSILICGGNSSGKTTMLNALKEEIPYDRSVLVIQQAEELSTKSHPDMIFLHSVEGKGESDTYYDLRELSIAGLTMDVEYFIIGEVKGGEATYLLNASYTGQICAATIHSYNSQTALDKLVDYALYNSSYTKPELMSMLSNFKTVVFMKNFKVAEISEVDGYDGQKMNYRKVYSLKEKIDEIPDIYAKEDYTEIESTAEYVYCDESDNEIPVKMPKPSIMDKYHIDEDLQGPDTAEINEIEIPEIPEIYKKESEDEFI